MRAVNLLPAEPKRTRKAPGVVTQLAFVAPFVVGGLLAAGYLLAGSQVNSKRATLRALQDELAALPAPSPATQQSPALASERSLRIATLSATLQSRLVWDRVLREISQVLPGDVWLTTLSAQSPETPASVAAPTPAAAAPTPGSTTGSTTATTATPKTTTSAAPAAPAAPPAEPLDLQGYTYSQEGVARLLSRLQVVPALQNVKLISSSQSTVSDQSVYSFTIQADVRPQEAG
ncbi:MAG: PilN domain-containing protein [Verrucomicrobiota bacterium]